MKWKRILRKRGMEKNLAEISTAKQEQQEEAINLFLFFF
jgi:hypothetical protein